LVDQFEIDLFFEGIDSGDLNGEIIAEADDAAGSATHQLVPGGVEHVEVIRHTGEMDQAAHGQFGHIDEEPEIAHVGHQGGIRLGPTGIQLRSEVSEQLDVFAVAFGVGRVAFGDGKVAGGFGEGLGHTGLWIEQGPVDHQVRIAPDGRGEMRIAGFGETVMADRFGGVLGAHEGLEETDLQGGTDGELVEAL
jgi:hypothetical protein